MTARLAPLACAAILIAACGQGTANGEAGAPAANGSQSQSAPASAAPALAACSGAQSKSVAFTCADASDTVRLRVDAEDCAQAAALVTVRDADGALLFADAFKLKDLALQEPPAPDRLDDLLSSFTDNISTRQADGLAPFEAATTEGTDNPTAIRPVASQRIYERARAAGGTVLCFNVHYSTLECLWHDAERGGTFHLYYSGT
ncbi:MAG: hypothetical protein ACFE0P_15350 [Oceanicaulis sp.]